MDGGSILSVIGSLKQEHGEQLGARIDKGAGLWYAGQVAYHGSNLWTVYNGKGESYEVRFNLKWSCTCPDCQHGAPEVEAMGGRQKVCKHQIACWLSWLIDSPDATTRPHPAASIALPGWLVKAPAHQDSADMGIDARDAAPPAWFGDNIDIEEWLG